MRRVLAVAVCLAPLAAWAVPPQFSKGGLIFVLQGGYGLWAIDRGNIAAQLEGGGMDAATAAGEADIFAADALNGPSATARLGYNILGHATVHVDLTGTGWRIFESNRGGAGFLVGGLSWHPLELIFRGKERPVDASAFFGAGYGIAGQRRGMDGLIFEAGGNAEFYIAPSFYVGLQLRWVFFNFNNFYISYDQRREPGMTWALPKGSGGSFFTAGLALGFRFIP